MWYNVAMFAGSRRGQAALEYVLALVAVMAVAGVLAYLVSAARSAAWRSEVLVGADCP